MTSHSLDLSALLRAANEGNDEAYGQLLRRLAPELRKVVRHGLARARRSMDDVDDIVQETMLAIHLSRHNWDTRRPPAAWIRGIARHKLIDALRRRRAYETLPTNDIGASAGPLAEADPDRHQLLSTLWPTLPSRSRTIVWGILVEGRSAREMSARLNISEGAVRVALHRALKRLSRGLTQDATIKTARRPPPQRVPRRTALARVA
ncbi:MAG: sigma-70 family RNA polymerase sigma factor [Hyphomicrobiaceae bacterium]